MKAFRQFIENYTALADNDWAIISQCFEQRIFEKDDLLLEEGKICRHLYFIESAKGELLPDKGPKSKFIISELVPNKSYTFKTKIPFGWLIIKRTLEVRNGTTYFTHDVAFTGILKKFLGNKLGKNYMTILPEVLKKVKLIAEQK
jgi:hypothetical protein